MSKSEDIKLQVNQVRHKKSDGTLYLMAERLAWMPDNEKNLFTISHKYSDIKTQKISPEGKAKIQLQIVLSSGETTTFQFQSIDDRTIVKDALLQILPQFAGKHSKDRERKIKLLERNTNLRELYKDLVETKVITADQFWSRYADEDAIKEELHNELQDVGVSADFLAGIPLNGKQVQGSVPVETLWAILKLYPKVAQKHNELVPSKMTETEFWNKFFQSRYFHRDRSRDFFTDCAKADEKEWLSSLKNITKDPFLDLDMFDDNVVLTTEQPTTSSSDDKNPNALLMKRFNQNSIRILETLKSKKDVTTGQQGSELNAASIEAEKEQISLKAKRRDWSFDDLRGQDINGDYLSNQSVKEIHISKDRYTIMPHTASRVHNEDILNMHAEAFKRWRPNLIESISPVDAVEAFKDLSPGGALMQSRLCL